MGGESAQVVSGPKIRLGTPQSPVKSVPEKKNPGCRKNLDFRGIFGPKMAKNGPKWPFLTKNPKYLQNGGELAQMTRGHYLTHF